MKLNGYHYGFLGHAARTHGLRCESMADAFALMRAVHEDGWRQFFAPFRIEHAEQEKFKAHVMGLHKAAFSASWEAASGELGDARALEDAIRAAIPEYGWGLEEHEGSLRPLTREGLEG
jgi:hypothetical protein